MDIDKKIKSLLKKNEYRPTQVIIVKNKENRFLILNSAKSKLFWGFPQGGIEENESLKQNLLRELKEEINIKEKEIKIVKLGFYLKTFDIPEAKGNVRGFTKGKFYVFSLVEYVGKNNLKIQKEEVAKYVWLNKKETLKKFFTHKEFLKRALVDKEALDKL